MSELVYIGVDLSSQPDLTAGQVALSRAALAALPEVQALIAGAVAKEREACAQAAHDAVTHPSAYACVAAIRKRGEG